MTTTLRERIHRRVNPHDVPFRFRGAEPTRTEALTDAVIGFAITLAVVALDVPRDSTELLRLVRGFASFGVTFLLLFSTWFSHHKWCRRYGLEDERTIWLTGALLFVVVFYTYPLKFLSGWMIDRRLGLPGPQVNGDDLTWVIALYGVGFACVGGLMGLLYRHAASLHDLLELDAAELAETRLSARQWFATLWPCGALMLLPATNLVPREHPWRLPVLLGFLVVLFGASGVYFTVHNGISRQRRALARAGRDEAAAG
jgi:hypothetical protein